MSARLSTKLLLAALMLVSNSGNVRAGNNATGTVRLAWDRAGQSRTLTLSRVERSLYICSSMGRKISSDSLTPLPGLHRRVQAAMHHCLHAKTRPAAGTAKRLPWPTSRVTQPTPEASYSRPGQPTATVLLFPFPPSRVLPLGREVFALSR